MFKSPFQGNRIRFYSNNKVLSILGAPSEKNSTRALTGFLCMKTKKRNGTERVGGSRLRVQRTKPSSYVFQLQGNNMLVNASAR
jgi:hypothetical protein